MTEPTGLVYLLALVPAVLWGFGPIFDKRGMDAGGSSLQGSLVVVVVDSTLYWLVLFALRWPNPLAGLQPSAILVFILAGVVGTALGRLAVFTGVKRVGASVNSAGISTRPLFATVLGIAVLGESVGTTTLAGVPVLVAGLVVLTYSRGGDVSGWDVRDLIFPVGAAAIFAVGNALRRFGFTNTPASPIQAVAINETAALVVLLAYALVASREDVLSAPRASFKYFIGSGVLTAVALLSMFAAFSLPEGRLAVVDPLGATAPLFTALFAAIFLRDVERVTRGVVFGAGLVVVGAVLITL